VSADDIAHRCDTLMSHNLILIHEADTE